MNEIKEAEKDLLFLRKTLEELNEVKPENSSSEGYNSWKSCYYLAKSLIHRVKYYIELYNANL